MLRYGPVLQQLECLIKAINADLNDSDITPDERARKQTELITVNRVLNITILDRLGCISANNGDSIEISPNKTYSLAQCVTGRWLVEEINRDTGKTITSVSYDSKQSALTGISDSIPNLHGRSLHSSISE